MAVLPRQGILLREYKLRIEKDEEVKSDAGFDNDWLHCYAQLSKTTTQRLLSENLSYETNFVDMCKSSELNKSDEFLHQSCGETISIAKDDCI